MNISQRSLPFHVLQRSRVLSPGLIGLMFACFCAAQAIAQTTTDRGTNNLDHTGQVGLSEILIATPQPYNKEQVAEARSEAEEIRRALGQGDSFEDLARKRSQGPSASSGGDVGYFCSGQLGRQLEDLAFRMNVGDISDVVRTKQGFVIFKIADRQPICTRTNVVSPKTNDQSSLLAHLVLQKRDAQPSAELLRYIDVMKERIYEKWYELIPKSARLRQGSLAIEFSVQRDGSITERKVSASSGDADLDKAALSAIGKAAPFPPLPDSAKQDHVNLRLSFQYNPSASPQN
jgi:TonB family protein